MTLAGVKRPSEGDRKLADESVVGYAEVTKLQGEPDEVGYEVGGMNSTVDEDGPVDVWMASWRVYRGLDFLVSD